MKEECLICKAPLEYLTQDEIMECAICHKQERSKTRSEKNNQCIGKRCPFVGGKK